MTYRNKLQHDCIQPGIAERILSSIPDTTNASSAHLYTNELSLKYIFQYVVIIYEWIGCLKSVDGELSQSFTSLSRDSHGADLADCTF